jgi:hypothetical protein
MDLSNPSSLATVVGSLSVHRAVPHPSQVPKIPDRELVLDDYLKALSSTKENIKFLKEKCKELKESLNNVEALTAHLERVTRVLDEEGRQISRRLPLNDVDVKARVEFSIPPGVGMYFRISHML